MFDEFKHAFQRPNNAHIQLIIINVVIFCVLLILSLLSKVLGIQEVFQLIDKQFIIPSNLSDFITRPWTILTYSFAHSRWDLFHILFNMLGLYWFGRLFVEYLGGDKLIALYVLGAIAGGVSFLIFYQFYSKEAGVMVGASGAINAIVTATATLLPNYTFYLLFFGPVRIKYIAFFFVVSSLFYINMEVNIGGNIAHLGGAIMGFIYLKQLQAGVNWGSWITVTLDWVKELFASKPKVKVSYRSDEPQPKKTQRAAVSKTTQDEIDAILDKISERGYESLSKEEKEKLFNASKK